MNSKETDYSNYDDINIGNNTSYWRKQLQSIKLKLSTNEFIENKKRRDNKD